MLIRGLLAVLFVSMVGCGDGADLPDDANDTASDMQEITVNSLAALEWANGWIGEVKAQPSRLLENEYTASSTTLTRRTCAGEVSPAYSCFAAAMFNLWGLNQPVGLSAPTIHS